MDSAHWKTPSLFLTTPNNPRAGERLSVRTVNVIWDEVYKTVGVEGETPYSARHAMGKHIIEKAGNIAAVQRQLGHRNAVYSMQYARINGEELRDIRVAVATTPTLEATIDQRPRPVMPTIGTGSAHQARMLLNLVRFR